MILRPCARESSCPQAKVWMSTFPQAVASVGPVRTFLPVALLANWASRSFLEPTTTTCTTFMV